MWVHVHLISTLIGINWFKSRLCFSKWLQPLKTRKELSLKYKGLPKSPPGPWFSTSPSPKPGARPPQLRSVQGTQWDEGREPHVPSFPPSTSPICGFLNSAKLGNKQTLKTQHCETQQCCNTFRTWSWPPSWTNVKAAFALIPKKTIDCSENSPSSFPTWTSQHQHQIHLHLNQGLVQELL